AVEIEPRQAGRGGVEAGIDVIRPGLHAAHLQAAPGESPEQADRQAGLARAGAWRADYQGTRRHAPPPRSFPRIDTMWPITIRAGASMPCREASSAMVETVATAMRSLPVVAEAITAAGVSAGMPASVSASAIRGRFLSPM